MPDFNHNQPIYSISEIAGSIKRMVEDHFGKVRLRGEISGWKLHSSGHCYFTLKDNDACIDSVMWRGSAAKLPFKPEDGIEVVVDGKITTYPGRSKYQIVVDHMEPAGAGALMAVLEKRKKMLEAEGLFRAERKRALPYLPKIVGVITSPTGAVIRDILHRIEARFPVHVIVWPVAVQGEGAAEQVAHAINGFNAMDSKPDVLIVARGGGSIEDLWAFNEEIVVRAAANSAIPLISAVGHETDTTLIDFASDRRAPTPTAAAEMAVPVREELLQAVGELGARLMRGVQRLLEQPTQRLDDWAERLDASLPQMLERKEQQLALLSAHIKLPSLEQPSQKLADWSERLDASLPQFLARKEQELAMLSAHLKPQALIALTEQTDQRLSQWQERMNLALERSLDKHEQKLAHLSALLESVNYKKVLERGFALVRDEQGALVSSAKQASSKERLTLTFNDGDVTVKH